MSAVRFRRLGCSCHGFLLDVGRCYGSHFDFDEGAVRKRAAAVFFLINLSCLDGGEVDIGVGDLVEVAGQGVQPGVHDDLDDLPSS
jgi:hypothetical protein